MSLGRVAGCFTGVRQWLATTSDYIAKVAELVDALDLGSSAARLEGSNPFFRTSTLKPHTH